MIFALATPIRGMNYILRLNEDYRTDLRQMREWGATDVELVVVCNQSGTALTCEPVDSQGAIRFSRQVGMRAWLKPHVETREFSWRGAIFYQTREEWDEWWANYRKAVLSLARLKPDVFVVGTELVRMSSQEEVWRPLVDEVRGACHCTVLYAATTDEAPKVTWWDAVDAIGIDAYYPLESSNSEVACLVAEWEPHVREIESLAEKWNKRVVLTEIGYQSRAGSYQTPWQRDPALPSEQDQANAYQAVFQVFRNKSYLAGILWWDWNTREKEGTGFTPTGKLAEKVVRGEWKPTLSPPQPVLSRHLGKP